MEYENRYASRGVGNAGLTTGIIGTALGALGTGIVPNILGGMFNGNQGGWGCGNYGGYAVPVCSDNMAVNRYEAAQSARIAELETEVKLRDANTYTLQQINGLRDYVERKFDHVEHELCDQKAFNAGTIGKVGCIEEQLHQLYGLTRLVIPNRSVCPGWGDVTVTPAAPATTAAGA